jgi:RNase H-like domain found in reverse transcriptase/Integrase zinc binding domain/Reverse transcriptase (RNA-dependent DNA polymerase)
MPFGLTNAPATFMGLMQTILHPLLDVCVIVYIDDILIYSKNSEDHLHHLEQVLELLRKNQLYGKLSKCDFFKSQVDFLGHVVSANGIAVEPVKIDAIQAWPTPTSLLNLMSFLGLANFYRRFVANFSVKASPLTDLLKKDRPFAWTPTQETAFNTLKEALTHAPVLRPADPSLPFTLTTDASSFAIGGVLSQDDGSGARPVCFGSRKLSNAEQNYPTHEQELLAVVHFIRSWRHYLDGQHFVVKTDHQSLKYLDTQPHLSKRQIRWVETLQQYDYTIEYQPGSSNQVADALSRRPDHQLQAISTVTVELSHTIKDLYVDDRDYGAIYKFLSEPNLPLDSSTTKTQLKHYELIDGLLYLQAALETDIPRLCIPYNRQIRHQIIASCHDSTTSGHLGFDKTYDLVCRAFIWPRMVNHIKSYVATCDTCQWTKTSSQLPTGLLQPLPTPGQQWEQVTMDFIIELPETPEGHNMIVVFVDRLSKMVHLQPTTTTATAMDIANIFFKAVF